MPHILGGGGHNKIRIRLHTKMDNREELMINFLRAGWGMDYVISLENLDW